MYMEIKVEDEEQDELSIVYSEGQDDVLIKMQGKRMRIPISSFREFLRVTATLVAS